MRYFLFQVGNVTHCLALPKGKNVQDWIDHIWRSVFAGGIFVGMIGDERPE